MKLEIGQKLYSETKNREIKTHVISKVGNKYFEVENDRGRYYTETLICDSQWKHNYI